MDVTIETLQAVLKITKDANLEKFIQDMEAAGKATASLGEISKVVGDTVINQIKGMTDATKAFIESFGGFAGAAKQMQEAGSELFKSLVSDAFEYLNESENLINVGVDAALAFEPLLNIFPKAITGMGQLGSAGYDAGFKITTAFQGIQPLLSKIMPEKSVAWIEGMSEGATAAFGLQRELVSLAAAQGNFSSMLDEAGDKFGDLNQAYVDMAGLAYDSSLATGQTVGSMMDLAKALGSIPGALAESVDVALSPMSQLVATSQLATGFMRSQSEVVGHLNTMYTDMGISGQKALESLANIYDKAGDSKLRFETFTKTVLGIADSFKILGDNTNAAANVVHAFDEAFKNSDISPAAMETVIKGLTSGIEDMDRAKQAFISSASGGPGGLAGAFQIEYALQTGKMDEVLQKTMTAMQAQFGGQVLTLQDAAQNPALAGEFYKQVQYLTQVAGVAKTDREAYRILEAMQSGVMDILQPGAGEEKPGGALEVAVNRGADEQARTTSAVMRFHQDMEFAALRQHELFGRMSTALTERLGIPEFMGEKATESKARGVIGAEESKTFVRESRAETFGKLEKGVLSPILEPVTKAFGAAMERGGTEAVWNIVVPPKEEEAFREPVGARLAEEELGRTPVGMPRPAEEEELIRTPVGLGPETPAEGVQGLSLAEEWFRKAQITKRGAAREEQEPMLERMQEASRPLAPPPVRTGVEAGMVPIAGEEPVLRAPASLEPDEVTRRAKSSELENEGFPRTLEVTHAPIKIILDLPEFNKRVEQIVATQLGTYQQGRTAQAAGGVATVT